MSAVAATPGQAGEVLRARLAWPGRGRRSRGASSPGSRLGDRAADGEVEAKAAGTVSDKITWQKVGRCPGPRLDPRLMTLSSEETLGDQ